MMTVFHMDSKENVDDRMGPLALAEKEEPIEKKIGRPGGAIDLGDPVIVESKFRRLRYPSWPGFWKGKGRIEAGDQPGGAPCPASFTLSNLCVGNSPTASRKRLSLIPSRPPPNMISLARTASAQAGTPVDKGWSLLGRELCERPGLPGFGRIFHAKVFNFLPAQKGEIFQESDGVAIVDVDEER